MRVYMVVYGNDDSYVIIDSAWMSRYQAGKRVKELNDSDRPEGPDSEWHMLLMLTEDD